MRHTYALHFMMSGRNIYDLQKILGHSDLKTTLRYAHLAEEHILSYPPYFSFFTGFTSTKFL